MPVNAPFSKMNQILAPREVARFTRHAVQTTFDTCGAANRGAAGPVALYEDSDDRGDSEVLLANG